MSLYLCNICDYQPASVADQLDHLRDVHGIEPNLTPEIAELFEEIWRFAHSQAKDGTK